MVDAFRWMVFVIGLAVVIGSIMITSAEKPEIEILSPSDDDTVYTDIIMVSGRANRGTDVTVLESVTVKGDLAEGTSSWRKFISLQPGLNEITAVATDTSGKWGEDIICVTYIEPNSTPTIESTPIPTTITRPNGGHRPTQTSAPIPTPTPTPTGSILITTIPGGAKVYVDDFPTKKNTNITLKNVTVGSHEIKVIKEGFRSGREYKYVNAGRTEELDFVLEPLTDSIFVFSTPPGASVYLDNDDMNKSTPCVLKEVAVGLHTIKLTKSGYSDGRSNEYVSAEEQNILDVTLRRCGSINISSNSPGANVYLDGNDTGKTTPANISNVALGNHIIKLTKFGYSNNETEVNVSVAETYLVNVNLSGYGSINITSEPSGAKVYLDGFYKGETPTNISKVARGNHTINLTKFCYDTIIRNVSVSVGERVHLDESLTGYCFLSISSNPSGAEVYLDGDRKGKTLLKDHKVVVGSHSYKLKKFGYVTVEKNIVLSAERKPVHEDLSGSLCRTLLLPAIVTVIGTVIVAVIIEEVLLGSIRKSQFIRSIRSRINRRRR